MKLTAQEEFCTLWGLLILYFTETIPGQVVWFAIMWYSILKE